MASEQGHTDDLEQLWTEVEDAVGESLNNADGRVSKFYLEYYFMKAGLGVFRLPDDPVGLQAAAPLMKSALEACRAWHEAESKGLGSFDERMELCSFSEWLTRKALAVAQGLPFTEEYEGVPHLIVWPECTLRRATEKDATELVAALTKAQS